MSQIGDYESMIIFRKDAPKNSPSANVNSLIAFIDWKTQEEGTLVKREGGEPYRKAWPTRSRHLIKADGGWRSPDIMRIFGAAISTLHTAAGKGGERYEDPCEDCIELYEKDKTLGCRPHAGNPKLWRVGNPRQAAKLVDRIARLKRIDFPGYKPKGDTMLLPQELIGIRNYLLLQNKFSSVRLWTMILCSVRLFLRSDELGISDADFIPELYCEFTSINTYCLKCQ